MPRIAATEPGAAKERFRFIGVDCAFNLCCNVLTLLVTFANCLAAGVLKVVSGVMFVLVLTIVFFSSEVFVGVDGAVREGVKNERSLPPNR